MVPDLGSLCGLFWGGGAQVCADSRAHIPVKLRDQLRASLLSGSPPWFLSLGLSASLELIM